MSAQSELVLVTGGSGFVGVHCILQLLGAGYRVRTTVRSLKREADVRAMLKSGGAVEPIPSLSFVEADLTSDAGWKDAVIGCAYIHHVASPFPSAATQNEDDVIVPARDGTLRVLRFARDLGVKRVIMTSSFAAIGYGHEPTDRAYTEADWGNATDPTMNPYIKSKILAESAAWEFITREGGSLELTVVNPVGIFGPVLGPDFSTSIQIVQRLMDGAVPASPRISFAVVDVRDVADLHLRCMTRAEAKGQRFLAASGDCMSMTEIALLLKARMGTAARRVPTTTMPDWLIWMFSFVSAMAARVLPELGNVRHVNSEKASRLLGWSPRSREDAIIATAESLVKFGLLVDSKQV